MTKVQPDETKAKSYALRLLIHYMGDIHQPLHCMARINENYPAGDKGANDFPVPMKLGNNNLHSVWDSAIYLFKDNDKLVSITQ